MKALKLAIFTIIFYTSAFGAGGGGGSEPPISYTNQEYYCFKDLGKSTSTEKLPGSQKYCVPVQNGPCSWKWDLDYSKDTPTQVGCNSYACDKSLIGMQIDKPVEIYTFCVKKNTWNTIAQCVDKTNNKTAESSKCNGKDANYYWKPKCEKGKGMSHCEWSLDGQNWFYCFNENTSQGKQEENGYVKFKEWKGGAWDKNINLPCKPLPSFNSGMVTPKPDARELIIRDYDNSDTSKSIIWTKISGNSASFKIHAKDKTGNVSGQSGIAKLYCTLDGKEAQEVKEEGSGLFGLNKFFVYRVSEGAFPASGTHEIKCVGTSNDGGVLEGSASFYSAPASYKYDNISANFAKYTENLTTQEKNVGVVVNTGEIKSFKHYNKAWQTKPVIPSGYPFKISLDSASALNAKGAVDTGVDSTIKVDIENKSKKITSSDIPPHTADTSACKIGDKLQTNPASFKQGVALQGELLTLSFLSSLLGEMTLTLQDETIKTKIDNEKATKKCDAGGNSPKCPYPGIAKISFEYQAVPSMFGVELLNHNGAPLKVLYFGQGHNPKAEKPNKIRITAESSSKTDTTFSDGCGAQDIIINLNADKSALYHLQLVNEKGDEVGAKIPYDKFKSGVAEYEVYIKVMKNENMPFMPNMKSEPVFLTGGVKANIAFAGFTPDNSYYPKYDGIPTGSDMVILRARINAIDTDNGANLGSLTPNASKVYYEFQCEYCNLDAVGKITGVKNYKNSPTQQGWFIDETFSTHNATTLQTNMASVESTASAIKSISAFSNGLQSVDYNPLATPATHKLNIAHGNGANKMPYFLLYNSYWSGNEVKSGDEKYLHSHIQWNTSAFIYMKGNAQDEQRNYGVDTGGAKNTRSGGRIGKY